MVIDGGGAGIDPAGPLALAEDEQFRSARVCELVRGDHRPSAGSARRPGIPKVIVQFWDDLETLPADVAECMATWEPLAALGYRRELFDDSSGRRFILENFSAREVAAFDRCGHPAMRCDYFRMCYIACRGGFYVDADDVYSGADCAFLFADARLKVQPLCFDTVTEEMVAADAYLRHSPPSPTWIYYVNNNPIVAPPAHPIVRAALARATRILLDPGTRMPGVQSTTGPGNLTASLVAHDVACERAGSVRDYVLLPNWDQIAISRWPLSYRADVRNWRLWNPTT